MSKRHPQERDAHTPAHGRITTSLGSRFFLSSFYKYSRLPADAGSSDDDQINMSDIDQKLTQRSTHSASKQNMHESVQYDEATTFSDPLPTKDSAYVSSTSGSDEEGTKFAKNPFLDPDAAAYWRAQYEACDYECKDVFDPTLEWTEEEERAIVRRLDWRVCLWAVCFHALFQQS